MSLPNDTTVDDKVDTLDALNIDVDDTKDDEPIIKDIDAPLKAVDDKDDEEVEDEKEKEDELDLDEPEVDDSVYTDVPNRKAILAAYPDIFKKFPGMEHAIYREKQYTEQFATPKEATEAKERLTELESFAGQVVGGDLEGTLKVVKQQNPDAFNKLATNYLKTLAKVDEGAYFYTLNMVIDGAIFQAAKSARENGDDQLEIAAQLMNKFVHGNTTIRPPRVQAETKENEAEKKLKEKEQQFVERKFNDAVTDVSSRTDNLVKGAIDKNIDPKNQMSEYVKSKAIEDSQAETVKIMEADTRFQAHLDRLWVEASKADYNRASLDKIKNAVVAKAKSVLPDVIRRQRAVALKGSSARVKEVKVSTKRNTADDDRPARQSSESKLPNKKVSTLDFLNQD